MLAHRQLEQRLRYWQQKWAQGEGLPAPQVMAG